MTQPWNQAHPTAGWPSGPAAPSGWSSGGGWSPGGSPSGYSPPGYPPGGWGPAPPPGPQPTRSGTGPPLRRLLLALIALAVLALAGLVIAGFASRPAEVAYANDDYQVPPADLQPPEIPTPQSREEAVAWTTDNAVYQQTAPAPVRCAVEPLDVATADDASLKTHFEAQMECLVRVWQPVLTAAGFEIFRPSVTIYTDQISTACGSGDMSHNAFYCAADQQIYWSNTLGADLVPFDRDRWAGDEVMAHEFGHAVQGRTGIVASKNFLVRDAETEAASLEIRRRNEVQADCFAGTYLRSVSRDLGLSQLDVEVIQEGLYGSGDDVVAGKKPGEGNHGAGATRRYWGTIGLANSAVGPCNTYAAEPRLVR